MKAIEKDIKELNRLISIRQVDPKKIIKPALHEFHSKYGLKYLYIDVSRYNEEGLKLLSNLKIGLIKNQELEKAAFIVNQEQKCKDGIQLKDSFNISSSAFRLNGNLLLYFSCNSSYVDESVKEYFKMLNTSL